MMRRTFERWNAGEREIDPEIADPEMVVRKPSVWRAFASSGGPIRFSLPPSKGPRDSPGYRLSLGRSPPALRERDYAAS